jgi:hypothetical protein
VQAGGQWEGGNEVNAEQIQAEINRITNEIYPSWYKFFSSLQAESTPQNVGEFLSHQLEADRLNAEAHQTEYAMMQALVSMLSDLE